MKRSFLWMVLGMAMVVVCAVVAWGQGRGITVKIRAENDPNAPVTETLK
ncbi:MAG: hypothetical protein HN342_15665, partial [Nitrospina sp.]|nr:hypothetical protein [Nitrospina sp.]